MLDSPLLMFLSWYTYDANGDKLWLTGSSQFAMGDTEVTIPIEKVTHGEFMGSKTADRSVVGSVTITGNNCNDLTFNTTWVTLVLAPAQNICSVCSRWKLRAMSAVIWKHGLRPSEPPGIAKLTNVKG